MLMETRHKHISVSNKDKDPPMQRQKVKRSVPRIVFTESAATVWPLRSLCARCRTMFKASGVGKPRSLDGNSGRGTSSLLVDDVFGWYPIHHRNS